MLLLKTHRPRILAAALAGLMLAAGVLLAPEGPVPAFEEIRSAYRPSESWLLDRNGEVIAVKRLDRRIRRLEWVALADISPAAQDMLLHSEDRRFYQHGGTDWLALLASGISYIGHTFDAKRPRGGSTLTMQLAGLLDHALAPANSRRTLSQKWRQILAARNIERYWSKQEILEAYFNLVSFRGEITGIHTAAQALFGIAPSALDRAQSALLMALLKGPNASPAEAAARACVLLTSAPQHATVSCDELQQLTQQALVDRGQNIERESIAPHLAQKLLGHPGMRVASTLDANLQRHAIRALHIHLSAIRERQVQDGAVVVIDNRSGNILAYVGSSGSLSDAAEVDGASALRQAGSTLKPFLYGKAIDTNQLTAASVLDDTPIQLYTPMGLYVPQDYDRDFKGPVSLRTALASSLNVPAVRTLGLIGVDSFVQTLRHTGLDSLFYNGDHYGFSLALGGVDVRLIELTNAYRALANGGMWQPARYTPHAAKAEKHRIFSPQAVYIISSILSDRSARAMTFGLNNPLATRFWTAVKTGTSKDMRDNWCIGYSSRYTVGVWVGNFNGEPMHDVSGSSGAAPVWRELMDYLHAHTSSIPPVVPRKIISKPIRYSPEIEAPRTEWFIAGTELSEIKLAAIGTSHPSLAHILYPTDGTIIAMDPDIPARSQRIQFQAKSTEQIVWSLDDIVVGEGAEVGWNPTGGKHRLMLIDMQGHELDSITFEVRGALPR